MEVHSALPGDDSKRTYEERHELAIRHARVLVRNLAKELDRSCHRPVKSK